VPASPTGTKPAAQATGTSPASAPTGTARERLDPRDSHAGHDLGNSGRDRFEVRRRPEDRLVRISQPNLSIDIVTGEAGKAAHHALLRFGQSQSHADGSHRQP